MSSKDNQPLRIAQIIGKWVGGGVEAFIMNYYRNIDRSRIQFDFLCDSDSTSIPYEEIEKLGGKVILIPPYQKVFKYHKELIKVLKKGNYKIVHSHINTLSVFSLLAAKRAGIPIRIAHSHSTTNKKEFKRNILKLILRPLNKLFATNYMSCSEYAGRWMFGDKNYNNGKVETVKNAIELNEYSFNEKIRKEYRSKLGIEDNKIIIGHVGRLVETKNHSFLIDLFSNIKDSDNYYLVLIGQGKLEQELKSKVKSLGIKERVIFLGQRNDAKNWYQAFDILIMPSLYEGFGMVLLESQASNLPCLASSTIPKEAKLIDDFNFISLDTPIEEWINNMNKLLKSNKRKSNIELLSQKGYNISSEARKLENYYFRLIEEEYHA